MNAWHLAGWRRLGTPLAAFATALLVTTLAQADPIYKVQRGDWFNLGVEDDTVHTSPVFLQGGPQYVGPAMSYTWDLWSNTGELFVWISQTSSHNSSLHTHRYGYASMQFDDVVFSNGSGAGGVINVRLQLDLSAAVEASGTGVVSELEVNGSGGLWGRWYAKAHQSGATSTGVFTGLDEVNDLHGVFTSNPFAVAADQPVTISVSLYFVGTASWDGGPTTVETEALGRLNPAEVFVLPAGYTANSAQAGIVDNTWPPGLVGVPVVTNPVPRLELSAYPNPVRAGTAVAFEQASPGHVDVGVFDIRGRRVRALFSGFRPAGGTRIHWDGSGDDGRALPPGTYFARVASNGRVVSRALALIR